MTKKVSDRNVRIANLMRELYVLSEEMAYAMTQANLAQIARGNPTPRMVDILRRYQAFAKAATEAGL